MEITGYDVTLRPTGLHKITLDCIGCENDLETIRKVYNNPGLYQIIGFRSGSCEKELDHAKEEMKAYILGTNNKKENKTMNKKTETLTAIELLRMERDAYDKGYARGKYDYDCWYNKDLKIKKVIFNDPATIVFWADGTKTVAKAHGDDKFDKEVGLTVCISKKALGNRSNFDKVFKKWIKED